MSNSLPSRLKALAEFDPCRPEYEAMGLKLGDAVKGSHESARLQPLHAALLECVEALEQAIEVSAKYRKAGMDLFSLNGMTGCEALAKLQALVEGK